MLFRLRSQQATTDNADEKCKSMIRSQVDHNLTRHFSKIVNRFELTTEDKEGLHIMTQDLVVMDTQTFQRLIRIATNANHTQYVKWLMKEFKEANGEISNIPFHKVADMFGKLQDDRDFPIIKQTLDEGTTRMDA